MFFFISSVASLLHCLHQLKSENHRLEGHIKSLATRRDHLLAVNARLSIPFSSPLHPDSFLSLDKPTDGKTLEPSLMQVYIFLFSLSVWRFTNYMECYFFSLLIHIFFQKSEWILVKVLKQELDFKIGFKKFYKNPRVWEWWIMFIFNNKSGFYYNYYFLL